MQNIEKEKYYKDQYVEMYVEDGIMFNIYLEDVVMTLQVARLVVDERLKLFNGRAMPTYVDISNLRYAHIAAGEFMATREACAYVKAGVVIVKSKVQEILANSFQLIKRPPVPSRIFTDREKALEWLNLFKGTNQLDLAKEEVKESVHKMGA